MSCTHARRELQLYADGRLAPRALAPLEAHLAHCAACRDELAALEAICATLAEMPLEPEPRNLTTLVMVRVATYEARRVREQERQFSLRWADTLLAALLASAATLGFVLLDPVLRATFPAAFSRAFPALVALLAAHGPGSIPWVAWIVWVAAGLGLAIWFAGSEARAAWRRGITDRMAHQHMPQLRLPW
ncbi:MAG TPA: anti-sigma factor [Ktedonobacterales bacterium]|nr:anti-sigma factor [Ktedonobacterales bacterium]